MQKRVWIEVGDLVLFNLRESEDEKCAVVLKYLPD